MRVLLIDNEPNVWWLHDFLKGNSQEVVWAKTASSAREHIAQGGFHHAIVDVELAAPPDSPNPEEEALVIGLRLCKEVLATKWGKGNVTVYSILDHNEFVDRARTVDLRPKDVKFFTKSTGNMDTDALIKHLAEKLGFSING